MTQTKCIFLAISAVLAVAFCTMPVAAQGVFGTISGLVTDSTGAVVPGAMVLVKNVNTNVQTSLKTNSAGAYTATSLNPGVYDVTAKAAGFRISAASGIQLQVGANVKVDLTLQVGQASETVQVNATQSPLLQTQQSQLSANVSARELEQLPIFSSSGRNMYSLIPLAAGVSQEVGAGGADNNNLRINGDRPRTHVYLLDGTNIEQPVFGGPGLSPSVDSIQEFKVIENSMSAEYGAAGGGVVVAVTKSGTNQFHGSAYEYNRNENFDARNFFEDPALRKNPYNYNEFGGTIGGPIIKNKLFFFTDYQGIRLHGSSQVTGALVPDAAFREGNLSSLCTAGFDSSGNCLDSSGQIYYPGTSSPVPYDTIPTAQISSISENILALYPTSTKPAAVPGTNILNYSSPFNNTINRFNPRIDYDLSASDHIFGAFHRETGPSASYDLISGPAGETNSYTDDSMLTLGWTHSFGSSMLNDFHFGYLDRIGKVADYGQGFTSASDFGIMGVPNCLSTDPLTAGGKKCGTPGISINGFTALPTGSTLYEPTKTFEFNDNVLKVLGRHSLNFGTTFTHYSLNNYQPAAQSGSFGFLGDLSGNPFADFLFGALNTGANVSIQNAMLESRAWAYSFYVQDDYKVTSRLTLNLGLRYDNFNSFHELHDGIAFFDPYTATWEQFGVNQPSTPFDPYRGFGPRVGFSWNPVSSFVVRAGYGIMYPGIIGHGRAGDAQPGPNITAETVFPEGSNWSQLPTVRNPSPSAIKNPIPLSSDYINWSTWAPRHQTATYIEAWNFTVEKEISRNTVARVGYVGTSGKHLPINYDYNLCQQSPQSVAALGWNATTSPYCSPAAASAAGIWSLYVNPGYWGLAGSSYNSLQVQFKHDFSQGLSVTANFTWSKLMDDSSSDWGGWGGNDALGQNFYDLKSERSVSAGDVPARFTVAPIYDLPFGAGRTWVQRGLASQIVGGWRVSSIYTISDGYPFGITDNSYGYCNAAHVIEDRPNMIGNPLPSGFQQTLQHWFNTSAFDFSGTCPAPNLVDLTGPSDTNKAFGNAPRFFSNVRNPGLNNFDFSLQKDFRLPVGESTKLTFQGDAFNAINHPQFGPAVSDPTNSTFGTLNSTSESGRTLQLGLHLSF